MKNFICSWFHGGGDIKRDELGRINWQCRKCGRWADPIPLEVEHRQTAKDIIKSVKARGNND